MKVIVWEVYNGLWHLFIYLLISVGIQIILSKSKILIKLTTNWRDNYILCNILYLLLRPNMLHVHRYCSISVFPFYYKTIFCFHLIPVWMGNWDVLGTPYRKDIISVCCQHCLTFKNFVCWQLQNVWKIFLHGTRNNMECSQFNF